MRIIGIAIVAENGVLGDGKKQPFEFAEDWARYKRVTLGHPMVMGRATHDAIGRWLPGRTTIVVTRSPGRVALPPAGARADGRVAGSVQEALRLATSLDDEVYVAGGGEIYRQAWPYLTALDLTEVHAVADGSVVLPAVRPDEWREVRREPRGAFDFVGYERLGPSRAVEGEPGDRDHEGQGEGESGAEPPLAAPDEEDRERQSHRG